MNIALYPLHFNYLKQPSLADVSHPCLFAFSGTSVWFSGESDLLEICNYDLDCDVNGIYKVETGNYSNSNMKWTLHQRFVHLRNAMLLLIRYYRQQTQRWCWWKAQGTSQSLLTVMTTCKVQLQRLLSVWVPALVSFPLAVWRTVPTPLWSKQDKNIHNNTPVCSVDYLQFLSVLYLFSVCSGSGVIQLQDKPEFFAF